MAAAADFELDSELFGADDGGADVGLRRGSDDGGGFVGGGDVEALVSDVGFENIREGGVLGAVDDSRNFGCRNFEFGEAFDD
ncbi:hypothetical protein C2S52_012485 [Perilla frutescens var. hirtella]|nr:hypothetical protein C2S52_012485 [Perilla frutescens var. hirtella]